MTAPKKQCDGTAEWAAATHYFVRETTRPYLHTGRPSNTREATYTATVNDVSVRVTGL
jgi:hypothetical protein